MSCSAAGVAEIHCRRNIMHVFQVKSQRWKVKDQMIRCTEMHSSWKQGCGFVWLRWGSEDVGQEFLVSIFGIISTSAAAASATSAGKAIFGHKPRSLRWERNVVADVETDRCSSTSAAMEMQACTASTVTAA